MLSALRSSDPFEIVLLWLDVSLDFLVVIELLQFLLLHLLLQKLLLFGNSKLFVTAGETKGAVSVG
jgi:hypothetical protein